MQAKPDANTDCTGEHREGAQVNPGIIEHNEEPNDQDNVADDLRDGVLQRAIESAFRKKTL